MASIEIKLKPLPLQDVVYLQMPPGRRQDGLRELPSVRIVDLTKEQLDSLLEEFNEKMRDTWRSHNERGELRG